jgi:hypothetical protein
VVINFGESHHPARNRADTFIAVHALRGLEVLVEHAVNKLKVVANAVL